MDNLKRQISDDDVPLDFLMHLERTFGITHQAAMILVDQWLLTYLPPEYRADVSKDVIAVERAPSESTETVEDQSN